MTQFIAGFAAAQPWLNLAGLTLDFLGLILLAWEWRLALAAERREAEIAAREEMLRRRPNMPEHPNQEVFDDMRRRMRFREKQGRAQAAWAERGSWFTLALGVIALGILLQIAAAIPLPPLAG